MTRDKEQIAKLIYETQERLRADDDIPGSPWTPWESQTSHRERRIAYAMADAVLAHIGERREQGTKCKANAYSDPPTDCDFPFCGCDPGAERAVDTLRECGWLSGEEAFRLQQRIEQLVAQASAHEGEIATLTIRLAEATREHERSFAAHSASVLEMECTIVAAKDVAARYPWHPASDADRVAFYHAVEQLQRVLAGVVK